MSVQDRIDAQIKWLEQEIKTFKTPEYQALPNGKAYLQTLESSLDQFQRLKHTTNRG